MQQQDQQRFAYQVPNYTALHQVVQYTPPPRKPTNNAYNGYQ